MLLLHLKLPRGPVLIGVSHSALKRRWSTFNYPANVGTNGHIIKYYKLLFWPFPAWKQAFWPFPWAGVPCLYIEWYLYSAGKTGPSLIKFTKVNSSKMSKPKSSKADVPEGTYDMVTKTIGDIGTQTVTKYNSEEEEEKKQLIFVFELTELSTKSKPVTLSKWVTNASGAKAFGGELFKACGLNPKTADWDDLLNKGFVATVEHTDSGNAKVKNPTKPKAGTKIARGFMATNSCYLDKTFDKESFEAMPEFIQNAMIKSPEFEEFGEKKTKAKKGQEKGKAKPAAKKKK